MASALSSARLTPSPYCSPDFRRAVEPSGVPAPPHVAETEKPFGLHQHPWAHNAGPANDGDLDSGAGPWSLNTSLGAVPETYQVLPQAGPVFASSNLLQQQSLGLSPRGFEYAYWRDAAPAHTLAGNNLFGYATPSDVDRIRLSPFWSARPSAAPDVRGQDNCQLLDPGPSRLGSTAERDGVFATCQLQAALPSAYSHRPLAASKHTPQSQSTCFLPMMAVSQPEKRRNSLAAMQLYTSDSTKFSSRYHGTHTEGNASADHLTPDQNCALWLTNLPGDISYSELLGTIRNVGRIWCTYINLPDNIKHHTAAAKVVFFVPEAAQKLLSESWTRIMAIRNHRVKVSHNRIKYAGNAMVGKMSRVLIITGSTIFVNAENLRGWFKARFVFQEDRVIELIKAEERAVYEFRFGSYRCQAQMGKMALEKDRPIGLEKVEFGDDPCEVGETMASYGVAAERIQGRGL